MRYIFRLIKKYFGLLINSYCGFNLLEYIKDANDKIIKIEEIVNDKIIKIEEIVQEIKHENDMFTTFVLHRMKIISENGLNTCLPLGGYTQKDIESVRQINLECIETYYDKLKNSAPSAYMLWRELIDVNRNHYKDLPTNSCSVEGHVVGEFFGIYLQNYMHGHVLDIGCGPQPIPVYLKNYPLSLISGIDPISIPTDHKFNFVQGVAEFLPWQDGTFDTVIAATTMDHVLILDKVYCEVRRVLSQTGNFIVWLAFVEGAKKYDVCDANLQPVDKFHLFHFDKVWFEEGIKKYFVITNMIRVNCEIDHYFYCMALK